MQSKKTLVSFSSICNPTTTISNGQISIFGKSTHIREKTHKIVKKKKNKNKQKKISYWMTLLYPNLDQYTQNIFMTLFIKEDH